MLEFQNEHIVYEASATRYEINVSYILKKESDYDYQYVVSLVNFGECFFDSDLNFIGEVVLRTSRVFGGIDAMNIQNAIAEVFNNVNFVEFDHNTRRLVRKEVRKA
jgi:hypothetical protein